MRWVCLWNKRGEKKKKIGISSSKATKIDPRKEVSKPQTIGLVLKRKKRTYVFLLRAWLQREKIIFVLIWVFFLCGKCRSPGWNLGKTFSYLPLFKDRASERLPLPQNKGGLPQNHNEEWHLLIFLSRSSRREKSGKIIIKYFLFLCVWLYSIPRALRSVTLLLSP